ncbi:phosphoglycerate mutase [Bifidobacterium aemilianum]|uniref:Phosphoglycerate mutase n=1 Tax=Bifidobacterium aemilianum TaxID=2493120 RepID=A0A366KBF8_9BIFI|nr:histidine phosphatase family protein [Bifidobacterium aemilianum]RBP97991.1 phosphoglycerate mutase [Bifidobacterium aemilianum]
MGVNIKKVAKKAGGYQYLLMVMRHAKTKQSSPDGDFARPLTDKGDKQAKKMAKGLVKVDLVPDRIAASSAQRAQETLEIMLKYLGDQPKVDSHKSLYEDGVQAIWDQLAQSKDKTHRLMVLGHEPTLSVTCQWLASPASDPGLLDLLNVGLSPASIAIFGANKPLKDWCTHEADLLAFIRPKDLD